MQHPNYKAPVAPPPLPPRGVQMRPPKFKQPLGKTHSLQSYDFDFHNLSQDSGISPSPAQISHPNSSSLGRHSISPGQWSYQITQEQYQGRAPPHRDQTGVYDNFVHSPDQRVSRKSSLNEPNVIEVAEVLEISKTKPDKTRWNKIGDFFRRKSSSGGHRKSLSDHHQQDDYFSLPQQPPPPLPPRSPQGSNVFQPTMQVRGAWTKSPTLPTNSPFTNYDHQLSLYPSSTRDFVVRNNPEPPSRNSSSSSSWKENMKQRVEAKRNSLRDSSSNSETEDQPDYTPDDSSSFTGSSNSRIQRRRTHPKHVRSNSWRRSKESIEDLAFQMRQAQNEVLNRLNRIENVQQQITETPAPPPPPRDPRRRLHLQRNELGRPVSYSFESTVNNNNDDSTLSMYVEDPADLGLPIVDRTFSPLSPLYNGLQSQYYTSQPSFYNQQQHLVPNINAQQNYAQSESDSNCQQQHGPTSIRRIDDVKLRNRDSAISTHNNATSNSSIEKSGKSSPSSSISSKDSGCPPDQQQQNLKRLSRPLSALVEKSESQDQIPVTPPTKELSPPRSLATDPGFSTKQRRSRFRDAMTELEDVLQCIQQDQDLLDRAERRDLPTAHQELIAQARERFQAGPSEDNSRQDDSAAEMFSDMDNFMNWNTSSSFENVSCSTPRGSRRQRTPSNRRSGVIDKKKDDVMYRICAANNRPQPETVDPMSKISYSFLALDDDNVENGDEEEDIYEENNMPDIRKDDLRYRQKRDQIHMHNISDPQPKFGMPKEPVTGCSNQDYLHAVPDQAKYRSTFNPMKNPDLVLDDMAFRSLRRDGNLSDPNHLGIVRDPNSEQIVTNTCWHHKRLEHEMKREDTDTGPAVFYPSKNSAVMKSLSEHIAKVIRKQSGDPKGGSDETIVNYQDLRNPKIFEAMKYSLNLMDHEKDLMEKKEWEGKNLFQLLSADVHQILEQRQQRKVAEQRDKDSETSEIHSSTDNNEPETANELVVQHCILEHDLSAFNKALSEHLYLDNKNQAKKKSSTTMTQQICDRIESPRFVEREKERSDFNEDENEIEIEEEEESKEREEEEGLAAIAEETSEQEEEEERSKPNFAGANSEKSQGEVLKCCADPQQRNRQEHLKVLSEQQPLLLLACYFLAALHQFSGLDYLSILGIVCAAISMISMFFI